MGENHGTCESEEMNIIDDMFFQKMAEDIGFCEEMLSTILQQK